MVRTKTSAIPVLAILLLGLIMPLMMNQAKARFPTAPLITSVTPIAPPSPAPTAMPTTALATVGQYLPVIAAIIVGCSLKKESIQDSHELSNVTH